MSLFALVKPACNIVRNVDSTGDDSEQGGGRHALYGLGGCVSWGHRPPRTRCDSQRIQPKLTHAQANVLVPLLRWKINLLEFLDFVAFIRYQKVIRPSSLDLTFLYGSEKCCVLKSNTKNAWCLSSMEHTLKQQSKWLNEGKPLELIPDWNQV